MRVYLEDEYLDLKDSYIKQKRINKRVNKKLERCYFLLIFMFVSIISIYAYYNSKIEELDSKMVRLKANNNSKDMNIEYANDQIKLANTAATDISESYDEVAYMLATTADIAMTLDSELDQLKQDNLDLQDQLKEFEKRTELYDKYKNSLYYKGKRNDITYDQLETLDTLCTAKGLGEDGADLILAIALTESHGKEKAENPTSTAKGYGQFLSGTGNFVYTKLMGRSGYVHSEHALNGDINIEMMVYYIDYLNKKYNEDIDAVLDSYAGGRSSGWRAEIDGYLSNKGKSIGSINL